MFRPAAIAGSNAKNSRKASELGIRPPESAEPKGSGFIFDLGEGSVVGECRRSDFRTLDGKGLGRGAQTFEHEKLSTGSESPSNREEKTRQGKSIWGILARL